MFTKEDLIEMSNEELIELILEMQDSEETYEDEDEDDF